MLHDFCMKLGHKKVPGISITTLSQSQCISQVIKKNRHALCGQTAHNEKVRLHKQTFAVLIELIEQEDIHVPARWSADKTHTDTFVHHIRAAMIDL